MGLAGLTAVFGMGTGVTPPVWSPEKRPTGGEAGPGASIRWVGHTRHGGILVSNNPCMITVPIAAALGRRADRGGQAARLLGPVG